MDWPATVRIVVAFFLASGPVAAQSKDEALPEYTVKAGFLFNFAKYVEWPADAFEKPDSPYSIGVVGTDPFGGDLEKALQNKTAKNRGFRIEKFAGPDSIGKCHILFIPRTEKAHLPEILKRVQDWPVLVVGENEGFAGAGGTTNILIEKEKPRVEINPDAAEKGRLTIDPKLLRVATIVRTEK